MYVCTRSVMCVLKRNYFENIYVIRKYILGVVGSNNVTFPREYRHSSMMNDGTTMEESSCFSFTKNEVDIPCFICYLESH